MNDRKSPPRDDAGHLEQDGAPISVGRRRFAKGAAPVVLGTLISRPVLGAEYICTVSGHASGNLSAHPGVVNCDVGQDVAYWRSDASAANWQTAGIARGDVPNTNTCDFGGGPNAQGQLFNGFSAGSAVLLPTFYYSTAPRVLTGQNNPAYTGCAVVTTSGAGFAAASMRQVLDTTDGSLLFKLGRATVASLLNAAVFNYPISQERIIEMFNAVKFGGNYMVPGAKLPLSPQEVLDYFEKLYQPTV